MQVSCQQISNPKASRKLHELTPVAYSERLLGARVEHGRDDEEPGSDCTFTHAEEEAHSKEAAKGSTCCMCAERDGPNENVDAVCFYYWTSVSDRFAVIRSRIEGIDGQIWN